MCSVGVVVLKPRGCNKMLGLGCSARRSLGLLMRGSWARNISFSAQSVPSLLRSFINGEYVDSSSGETREVVNPATGKVLTVLQVAGRAEVDAAVAAARAAQKEWAKLTGTERGRILRRAADILTEKNDKLAEIEVLDTGRPIAETKTVDIVSARDCIEYFAGVAATLHGEHIEMPGGSFAYTRREPLGVTAGIGAWNYPIQGAGWKSGPALACGNTIVFKPAEDTPMGALALAEVYVEAGLPAGAFSVVLGPGSAGQLLSAHPEIAKVSFTGSVPTGKAVYREAAATLKRVTMELGGKSPLIIFEDADLDNAVSAAMMANWYSCGEVCSNGTRIFVQQSIKDAFMERLIDRTLRMQIGDPLAPSTDIGAVITEKHMNKILGYLETAKDEGANLVCGGERVFLEGEFKNGFYLSPAVFDQCTDSMELVREEIFGMVMAVLEFKDEEEVIRRANATEYGLSAGVFTQDVQRAHRVVAQLEAGTTWINNYNLAPVEIPWGGYKQSGIGRENGLDAINHWTQLKSVYVEMGDVFCPYK